MMTHLHWLKKITSAHPRLNFSFFIFFFKIFWEVFFDSVHFCGDFVDFSLFSFSSFFRLFEFFVFFLFPLFFLLGFRRMFFYFFMFIFFDFFFSFPPPDPPCAGPPDTPPPDLLPKPGFHTTARELQTCTFEGPGLQKHHQNSTRRPPERDKERKWERERDKKAKFRAPTLRALTFSRSGPHPSTPPLGPPTLRGPTLWGLHPSKRHPSVFFFLKKHFPFLSKLGRQRGANPNPKLVSSLGEGSLPLQTQPPSLETSVSDSMSWCLCHPGSLFVFLLGLKDKKSRLGALKQSLVECGTTIRWCHSAAQLGDVATKDSHAARAPWELFVRGNWYTIPSLNPRETLQNVEFTLWTNLMITSL